MPTIINNISNLSQTSYVTIIANPIPTQQPGDLLWTVGPQALTTAGVPGAIFSSIVYDNVFQSGWFHGGNNPIEDSVLSFKDCNNTQATYTTNSVISAPQTHGLFELRLSNPTYVASVVITAGLSVTTTTVTTTTAHGLVDGDLILFAGSSLPQLNNYWYVSVGSSSTQFSLNGASGIISTGAVGQIQKAVYYWDEVYTTPLGLYTAVDITTITDPGPYEFSFINNNSNEFKIYIADPNIIPQIGDSVNIQKFFNSVDTFTNQSTTDGINNVVNFSNAENYTFKITSITSINNPLALSVPNIEYTIILDKSFAPIISSVTEYMIVLLNRTGIGLNKELYTDTWESHEVQQTQLLGDLYNYVGSLKPKGRKNYLYYDSASYLGIATMLKDILANATTPFIILDLEDEIKDRIDFTPSNVQIFLPSVMLQGEIVPLILTNANPNSLLIPYSVETQGCNRYAPLYLNNGSDNTRYGWVFYDLRILIIDHPELATALSYNSNRNYTLPSPILPQLGNNLQNSTPSNRLTITAVSNTTPIVVTTSTNHNLDPSGSKVVIVDVLGSSSTNTPANSFYYVSVINNKNFSLFYDSSLSIPVAPAAGSSYVGGTGTAYSTLLAYNYFITYRLIGEHYTGIAPYSKTIDFNFQSNGSIASTNPSADVELSIPFLTHLVDNNNLKGFEANQWEVLIGAYVPSSSDPYTVDGIAHIAYLRTKASSLKDISGTQNSTNQILVTLTDYTLAVSNTPYDIFLTDPIYNTVTALPLTFFTGSGSWLIGNVIHSAQVDQYRMTFDFNINPQDWNGTTNPSFESGNQFMPDKLITEFGFFIADTTISTSPYIYAKVSPPVAKNNSSTLNMQLSIDF